MENETSIKTHYNKHELSLFKEPATRKLKFIKSEIRHLTKEYYAADDKSKTEFYIKLQTAAQSYNGIKRQQAKIHDGTFGICRVTGNLTPKERLMLMFHIWPKYPEVVVSHKTYIPAKMKNFHNQLKIQLDNKTFDSISLNI